MALTAASVRLYHWPGSFYSQKALMALEEKLVKYKGTIICLPAGEQNEAWYLRLNPKGQVPLIKVGDKYVWESEAIIDAVDKLNNAPVLVPDPRTAEGKLVQEWRTKLYGVDIEALTFGILLNQELAEGDIYIPSAYRMTKEEYLAKHSKTLEKLETMKEKYPELREALDAKIKARKNAPNKFEKSDVVALKEELEGLFDDLEVQLRKSRSDNIIEHWLCGPNFTVADISLCVFIGRLKFIGLFDRYLNPKKRPALVEYWNHAQLRPSVQKVILGAACQMKFYMIKKAMAKVATGAAVASGVLALGVYLGHKFKS